MLQKDILLTSMLTGVVFAACIGATSLKPGVLAKSVCTPTSSGSYDSPDLFRTGVCPTCSTAIIPSGSMTVSIY